MKSSFSVFSDPIEISDYKKAIKQPMCFSIVEKMLKNHKITTLKEYKHKMELIFDNSIYYNSEVHPNSFFLGFATLAKECFKRKYAKICSSDVETWCRKTKKTLNEIKKISSFSF